MKSPITLNIGLNDNQNSEVNVHTVCNTLASHGFNILASRVFDSPAGNEKCLVACVQSTLSEIECNARLYCVASCLRQDCIAVVENGKGELIGPNAETWGEFNPAFFVGLSGLTLAETAGECRVNIGNLPHQNSAPIIRTCGDSGEKECNGFTLSEFIVYLRETIIPDSKEAGFEGYATDLETALFFLSR